MNLKKIQFSQVWQHFRKTLICIIAEKSPQQFAPTNWAKHLAGFVPSASVSSFCQRQCENVGNMIPKKLVHDKSDNTGKIGRILAERKSCNWYSCFSIWIWKNDLETPHSTARDSSLLQSKTHDFRCYRWSLDSLLSLYQIPLFSRLNAKRAMKREGEEEKEQAQ